MTRPISHPWPVDHPEIIAIALHLMLFPARRAHYSSLVLMLADAAIERLRRELDAAPRPAPDERQTASMPAAPS